MEELIVHISDEAFDEASQIEGAYYELQKSFTNLVLREAKKLDENVAWVELTTQLTVFGLDFECVTLFDLADNPIDNDPVSEAILDFLQCHFDTVTNLYGWSMGRSGIEFK
jgi:hypothetical protein